MPGFGADVEGAARLRSTLDQAAADLENLEEPNLDVAGVVAHEAQVTGPRVSGLLVSTVAAEGEPHAALVTAGSSQATYARPVHALNPFITRAYQRKEADWVRLYEQYLDHVLEQIKGSK